jgi:hypothetical protein
VAFRAVVAHLRRLEAHAPQSDRPSTLSDYAEFFSSVASDPEAAG